MTQMTVVDCVKRRSAMNARSHAKLMESNHSLSLAIGVAADNELEHIKIIIEIKSHDLSLVPYSVTFGQMEFSWCLLSFSIDRDDDRNVSAIGTHPARAFFASINFKSKSVETDLWRREHAISYQFTFELE